MRKQIFLDDLPRKGKQIDWTKSIGMIIHFIYGNIEGDLQIVGRKNERDIIVKYKNKEVVFRSSRIKDCQLQKLFNKDDLIDWQFEVGQTIKDDKRDMIIIDKKIIEKYNEKEHYMSYKKYYKYHCNKCGYESWRNEGDIKSKKICPCCCKSPQVIVKDINDVATTNPELVQYFINKEDACCVSYGSNKEVWLKCPKCGNEIKETLNKFRKRNLSCSKCSDGVSYPEKFMFNVLEQLNLKVITQFGKVQQKWCKNYKYDFYFEYNNESYIIETHGLQHYDESMTFNRTLEEEQENDKLKKELALANGINHYIIINSSYSELEWMKDNILQSELNNIFDLSNIDWQQSAKFGCKSLVKEVCEYWNDKSEYESIKDVSKNFKIVCEGTIRNYLKQGTEAGWCNYDPKEESRKSACTNWMKVEVYKNDTLLYTFESGNQLIRESESKLGFKLSYKSMKKAIQVYPNSYNGFIFKAFTKEEILK